MTREEIDKIASNYLNDCESESDMLEVFATAKEALEQESILDKIRNEIEGMYRVILKDTPKDDWAVRWNDCLDEALQVIDKYRTEGEEREWYINTHLKMEQY